MDVTVVSQGRQSLNIKVMDILNSSESHDRKDVKYTEEDIKKAVEKFNKLLEDKATHIEYEIYGKFKDLTIKIINDKTKKVIKEIPPRKLIDMIDKLCELAGIFMDDKA